MTYVLGTSGSAAFILCTVCGLRSFSAQYIAQRYCGRCHAFHDDRAHALHFAGLSQWQHDVARAHPNATVSVQAEPIDVSVGPAVLAAERALTHDEVERAARLLERGGDAVGRACATMVRAAWRIAQLPADMEFLAAAEAFVAATERLLAIPEPARGDREKLMLRSAEQNGTLEAAREILRRAQPPR